MFPLLITTLVVMLTYHLVKSCCYWRLRNVKQVVVLPFFGDYLAAIFRRESFFETSLRTYRRFPAERYSGLYHMNHPMLVVRDPELLKRITVKDFDHFTDHQHMFPDDELWNRNLFALRGYDWREMRSTLSPAFTSSKMRAMFCLIEECALQTSNFINASCSEQIYEMKDLFTRYANDVIASCAFGIKCDSLKERDNEFYLMGKKATDFGDLRRNLKIFVCLLVPALSKVLDFAAFTKEVCNFFQMVILDNVKIREEQNMVRPDLIHLLMEAGKGKLSDQNDLKESKIGIDIPAQAMIFFAAGLESTSTVMSFMAYELAIHPDIQDKLQEEIDAIEGKLTYDKLSTLKYMDMVISESLRKWPPAMGMDRVCVKPYTIPAERSNESELQLKVGDSIWLPIAGLHMDPEYFPDPAKFDPERFNSENKLKIKPYTYNPFGFGPRNCIGSRLALLEIKTMFFHLLSKNTIEVIAKTSIPLEMDRSRISVSAKGGIWLGLKARQSL